MRKLSHGELTRLRLTSEPRERHPIAVLLENVRSVHNVGSILRTADAARLDRVVCAGITARPDHRGIHKTALGAEDTVPWSHESEPLRALASLKAQGFTLVALEQTDAPIRVDALSLERFPLCLVVGNEVEGVSQAVLDRCDFAIELPQFGQKQSLNVSVATGVATYLLTLRYRTLAGLQ